MTHEGIEKIIDALNNGNMRDLIFRTSLSSNVDFAKVWGQDPMGGTANEGSSDYYFIKNETGVYVGAVQDRHEDLHAFVKEASRKHGYLKNAMEKTILPKLYQSGREKQCVTFEDPVMGDYCVRHLGFKLLDPFKAEKDLSIYSDIPKIVGVGIELSKDEKRDIHIKIGRAKLYLSMIKEQLEMAYGKYDDSQIKRIKSNLSSLELNIERLVWPASNTCKCTTNAASNEKY